MKNTKSIKVFHFDDEIHTEETVDRFKEMVKELRKPTTICVEMVCYGQRFTVTMGERGGEECLFLLNQEQAQRWTKRNALSRPTEPPFEIMKLTKREI